MDQKNYHSSIAANVPANEAFADIANVGAWWTKSFNGSAQQVGDTFFVQWGSTKVDFEITEAIPDKKIVWRVTDSNLPWLKNKNEWTDTSIVWELSPKGDATQVDMTHVGLTPAIECYENCEKGWNKYAVESLQRLMAEGKGLPN